MKIAIAGGTGFVGSALTSYLLKKGHHIYILTRKLPTTTPSNKNVHYVQWLLPGTSPEKELGGIDAFINLAGESINSGRWTEERKKRILSSRLQATQAAIDIVSKLKEIPEVFINASAIGIYGTSNSRTFTEESTNVGSDFLATTVHTWENHALKAEGLGIRTVLTRFGIILGEEDGALPRMIMPYKFFIGGKVGSGNQWLSWVHIDDVVKSIEYSLLHKSIQGPINITAPQPIQMNDFGTAIAKVMKRPHWLPVPNFALKTLLGEMSILVLEGQRVLPEKLIRNGYHFHYESLEQALTNIIQSDKY
ncbi:TIGR01777 family oxidoreductase [Bacillus timonensis]|nr:TIGR01777 family oxidoreductase [Bacillus timonensis]